MFIPDSVISQIKTLSCEEVAKELGLNVSHHKSKCFMHDDKHPSLAFKGNYWRCFSCDKGGDVIRFVQEFCNFSFQDSCIWLCNTYGISLPTIDSRSNRISFEKLNKKVQLRDPVYTTEDVFNREVAEAIISFLSLGEKGKEFLFGERLLSKEIIEECNIKSLESPVPLRKFLLSKFDVKTLISCKILYENSHTLIINTPSLIIPYYDAQHNLVALQSRYLKVSEQIPRFKLLCNSRHKLYNSCVLAKMTKGDKLFIMEGITDCLAMLSSGKYAVAIPSATSIPLEEVEMLLDYSLFMVPDGDDAGSKAFYKLFQIFNRYGKCLSRVELPRDCNDYSEYYLGAKNKE